MQTSILSPQEIFFKIVRYEVPVFQRPYIWTKDDQWEPLWEDVSDMAEAIIETGEVGRHFMGAIVLQQRLNPIQGIETRIVVDGQQRLTTLQLLIDAVQEVFERDGYQGPAVRLEALVHTPEAFRGNDPDLAYKVWPTTFDQAAFRHAMNNELSSDAYKNSRIVAAHNYFKNKTEQWMSSFPEDDGRRNAAADALDNTIRSYLELVVIDLGSSDDPHVIFETLNARGTPLLPSDMIKNQILHKAGVMGEDGGDPEAAEADRLWPFAGDWWRNEIGRGHQRRPRIDVYLNNWLTLRNQSETKANNEFATFNDYVEAAEENGETVRDIAADIGRLGEIYSQIDQRSLPDIEPFLYRRQVMGVGVVIPALLWLLSSDVPRHQLLKSLTALEIYLVRRMACGMSARSYGQLFIGLVAELDKAGPDHAGEATVQYLGRQTAFANQWPDDQTLLDTFVSEPLYWSLTAGRLNLILQGIEGDLRTAWAESQSVPRDLHIEHVMPQGWQSDRWPLPKNDDEDAAIARRNRLIHSIGNLTLVNQRLNSALSNAPWHDERKTLDRHTVLFLNKDLLANAPSGWDETTIADRGEASPPNRGTGLAPRCVYPLTAPALHPPICSPSGARRLRSNIRTDTLRLPRKLAGNRPDYGEGLYSGQSRLAEQGNAGEAFGPKGPYGGRLSRQSIGTVVRCYAAKAGLTARIHPHVIRHSFATAMLEGGADLRVIQELMGHSSVATTQIYAHVTKGEAREAYLEHHPLANPPRPRLIIMAYRPDEVTRQQPSPHRPDRLLPRCHPQWPQLCR